MHKPYTLEMVHVKLQAVREDHFQKVSMGQPSDGPKVIRSPLKHVQQHSGGRWPTSVCEVHWGHISASVCQGPCVRAVVPLATS